MTVDIFIRTYHADLEWLKYCLRSIHKFVTGYRQIIICIPANEQHLLKHLTAERIVPGITGKNGYILQQVDKLRAYQHTDAEYILFIDSDVCYKEPCDISEYFKDGKPIIYQTPWHLVGQAQCWKQPTEEILGIPAEAEFMRRLPILYRRDTLQRLDEKVGCLHLASRESLSEFNLAGCFAKNYDSDSYYFWDTELEPNLPPSRLIQSWSWGGLTNDIKKQLEEAVK